LPPNRPGRLLAGLLAVSLLATLVLSGGDTARALIDTLREVRAHDSETLRLRHHGWYARLTEVFAAIEREVPADEPIVLDHGRVPAWFVAAYHPRRAIWLHSDELVAEWTAAGRSWWALQLREGEPLRWSLQHIEPTDEPPPSGDAPR
jgi:hypothetical protein